jgi:Uma2 family endonuclease
MSAALRPMNVAEFLEWEGRQELRYEFDGAEVEAMVGGTLAHAAILRNLAIVVGGALRGKPCQFYGSELKLSVSGRIRYPDGMVLCVPAAASATFVTEPTVIFEVLSDSTAMKDMTVKNDEYRAIPSVRRYVLLEQERVAALVFAREGEEWLGRRLVGPDAILDMPEIRLRGLALAGFYEGLGDTVS